MCALVREAIAAGAAGFSTSFSFAHRGVDGKPVPSRFADADEVEALFLAAGEAGKGVVLITPGRAVHVRRRVRVAAARSAARSRTRCSRRRAASTSSRSRCTRRAWRTARDVWPQVTPRPLTMQFTMADAYSLNTGQVFGELMKVSRAVRLAAYRDPTWRALAAADLEESPMKPRWETFEVSESERFPELQGRRVSDLARERGCSPLDVMCEIAVAEDLDDALPRVHRQRRRRRGRATCSRTTSVALGLSDAGAHIDQLCDAPLPTDLLGTWVRERGVHAARSTRCAS